MIGAGVGVTVVTVTSSNPDDDACEDASRQGRLVPKDLLVSSQLATVVGANDSRRNRFIESRHGVH
jgi:hypothetical protein